MTALDVVGIAFWLCDSHSGNDGGNEFPCVDAMPLQNSVTICSQFVVVTQQFLIVRHNFPQPLQLILLSDKVTKPLKFGIRKASNGSFQILAYISDNIPLCDISLSPVAKSYRTYLFILHLMI